MRPAFNATRLGELRVRVPVDHSPDYLRIRAQYFLSEALRPGIIPQTANRPVTKDCAATPGRVASDLLHLARANRRARRAKLLWELTYVKLSFVACTQA